MANFNQNLVFNGLGTFSFTIPVAGNYFVEGKISLPTIVGGSGPSSVVAVINKNGSPVYTGLAGAEGFKIDLVCAAADVIAVVLSSSASADQPLNVIKTNIAYGIGL